MNRGVIFLCGLSCCISAIGQGTVAFETFSAGHFAYPIRDCYGPLSGPGWTAQLWAGPAGTSADRLSPVFPTTTFSTNQPGYILRVVLSVPVVTPETPATVQVRVWNNENGQVTAFSNATIRAVSPLIEGLILGGGGVPPTLPATLAALGDLPPMVVSSPGCEPPLDECCFMIEFSNTNFVVSESQEIALFPLNRTRTSNSVEQPGSEQTVAFDVEDVTARLGQDYIVQSGIANFTSSSSALISAQILDNPFWSGARVFRIRLSDPGPKVVLGQNRTVTVTIVDDDTVLGPRRGINGQIETISALPGNKWIIGGDFTMVDGYRRNRIARLQVDGAIDTSFDAQAGANGAIYTIVRQADGQLIVGGGFTSFAGVERPFIVRLNETGEIDSSFASAIMAANPVNGAEPAVRQVLIQPGNKILVAGLGLKAGNLIKTGVVRLNSDGTVDPDFLPPATLTSSTLIELQADNKILVSEWDDSDRWSFGNLIRLNPNGSRDEVFVSDLGAIPSWAVRNVLAMTSLPNGQILVGGMSVFSENDLGLLLLEPSGQPASTQPALTIGGALAKGGSIVGMTWQSTEKLLITGGFSVQFASGRRGSAAAIVRLNANLTQDLSFSSTFGLGFKGSPAIQEDGTIGGLVVFGSIDPEFLRVDGEPVQDLHFTGIARLPDGEFHLALRGFSLALRGFSPFAGVVQVSSDLMTWQTVQNSEVDVLGRVFKETISTNETQRFYRIGSAP